MTISIPIGQSQRNKATGEPDDATSIKSGSEGDRWKSTRWGNSLAVYPTSTPQGRCFLRQFLRNASKVTLCL